jgi:hypothetical protein
MTPPAMLIASIKPTQQSRAEVARAMGSCQTRPRCALRVVCPNVPCRDPLAPGCCRSVRAPLPKERKRPCPQCSGRGALSGPPSPPEIGRPTRLTVCVTLESACTSAYPARVRANRTKGCAYSWVAPQYGRTARDERVPTVEAPRCIPQGRGRAPRNAPCAAGLATWPPGRR